MKKLERQKPELKTTEVLTREQLKNALGGNMFQTTTPPTAPGGPKSI